MSVLALYPNWKPEYDSWWASVGSESTEAFGTATDKEFLPYVRVLIAQGAPHMLETHLRNRDDKDNSEDASLAAAPVHTNAVESVFGCVDNALAPTKGASIIAAINIGHALKQGTFTNAVESRKMAKRRHHGAKKTPEEIELEERKRELKCFFTIPWDERKRLLSDISRRLPELRTQNTVAMLEHNDMKRARAKEKKEQVESKAMTKAMNESKYSAVVLVRNENELAVQRIALSTNARYSEYLRNQIRAWNHSQSIPKKSLVEIGKGCNEEEVQRLEKGVRATFGLPIKSFNSALPQAYPKRLDLLAPHSIAVANRAEYDERVRLARLTLQDLLSKGTFMLQASVVASIGLASKNRATEHPKAKTPRDPSIKQMLLVDQEFEEDGVDWKVLDVAWSPELEDVVVYYYEVGAIDEGDLDEIRSTENYEHDAIEFSSVKEVVKWIKDSPR